MQRPPMKSTPPGWPPTPQGGGAPQALRQRPQRDQYDSFNASLLYCAKCRQATPTRQRLLLVLPSGNLFEYLCAYCGTSTGSKTESGSAESTILRP